jgi:endonuclease G
MSADGRSGAGRSHRCKCEEGEREQEFDARTAFERLAKKQDELAQLIAAHMAAAPLPAGARAFGGAQNPPPSMAEAIQRIVGGFPVAVGEFPECCLIGRRSPNGVVGWFCTGVLVHPRIVLTAGHCFDPAQPANVVALNAENQNQLQNAEIRSVRRMVQHPQYPTTGAHDMSVIILRTASQVAPARMATTQELQQAQETTLVGFGNDNVLSTRGFGIKREVKVALTGLQRPGVNLDDLEGEIGFESDLEFVAGGAGFDSCNGDSGGPAYIDAAGERVVAGLTSRATNTARNPCGDGGIYTRVDVHMAFIRQVAADANISL